MTDDTNADQRQGRQPSDTEQLVGETAASDALAEPAQRVQPAEVEGWRAAGGAGTPESPRPRERDERERGAPER